MLKSFCFFVILFLILPLAVQGASLIDINSASSEELEKIIGIGPVLAQRIIEMRPFSSLDDLIKVKGIGEKPLQKIKDEGLAWVNPQNPPTNPQILPEDIPQDNPEECPQESGLLDGKPAGENVGGIIFNEILPSPEGPDETEEWVEIFNKNDFEVYLEH